MNRSRLLSIDFLRGGAALAVVMHHAVRYEVAPNTQAAWFLAVYSTLDAGHLGVPLFFVLSGFCIHLGWAKQYAETSTRTLNFGDFWRRRFSRLYPPYFVALSISMLFVLIAYRLRLNVPLVMCYPKPRLKWMALDFFSHAGMLHGLIPIFDRAGGNPVFWTLAREEYFYLMYFPIMVMRRKFGLLKSVLAVICLGLIFPPFMSIWLDANSSWWALIHSSAVVLWVQWCLGMVAVEAYYNIIKLPGWCASPWLVPAWAALATLSEGLFWRLSPVFWGLTFFTIVNACVVRERRGGWPATQAFRWVSGVGAFSYSLYLIHNPVRAVLKRFLGPLAYTSDPRIFLINAAVLALGGYIAGKLFFVLVERRFLSSHRVVIAPVASPDRVHDDQPGGSH